MFVLAWFDAGQEPGTLYLSRMTANIFNLDRTPMWTVARSKAQTFHSLEAATQFARDQRLPYLTAVAL